MAKRIVKTTHGQRIAELKVGQSIVLEKVPAGGSLEARKLSTGPVMFYWRHTREGKTERLPIGHYDSSAPPKALQPTGRGYSVAAALESARESSKLDRETPGGLRAERERQSAAKAEHARAEARRQKYTLEALCNDYWGWLKQQGKESWKEARLVFQNHLLTPHLELAAKPASQVEKREIVTVLRRLTEANKAPTARKLRSYLRAAYSCAVKSDSDASLPSSFIGYGVVTNPVEATAAIKTHADKNPLSVDDLRKYWKELQNEPGVIGAALRLHILTAGQRPTQLARLERARMTASTFTLLDPKGKRAKPREHLLPITTQIRAEIDQLASGTYPLSTDGGKTPMHASSLSVWSATVATRAGIKEFQLKRVRSGVETLLAEAGIPLHIRGQLQSHGIGGIQERSYDAYLYVAEKRKALETLYQLLNATPSESNSKRRRAQLNRSPMEN